VLSTVQLNVDYDPGAQCPAFERFVSQVVPPDVVDTIWELIGYLMYSGNPLHKAVMLTGTGRNGKGTFLRVMVELLGRQNITTASLHDLVNTRFTTASLFGRLANIAGDIDGSYLETTATLKGVTGGDTISAEHKNRDRFDFTPWAVPVFSANKIPGSADTTIGYLSRWLIVNFPHDFTGHENRTLDTVLRTPGELAGIAVRGLAALPRLLARGDFTLTDSALAAREDFVRRVDQVRTWLFDCTDINPEHPWLGRTELYQAYQRWAARDGHRPVKASEFYDRIEAAGALPAIIHGTRGFKRIKIIDGGYPGPMGAPGAGGPHSFTYVSPPAPAPVPPPADPPAPPRVQIPAEVPAPGQNPANIDIPIGLGAEGAGNAPSLPISNAPAQVHVYEAGGGPLHPVHPNSTDPGPVSAGITRRLLEARETANTTAERAAAAAPRSEPTQRETPGPRRPEITNAEREALKLEYHELAAQQALRLEEATRGALHDRSGRDSQEVQTYFGEGEFSGEGVEPRLTWALFLNQRRPGLVHEKAQQAAYDAGFKLGRRHALKPDVGDHHADYERAEKRHDHDAVFAHGYTDGIVSLDAEIAAAGGQLVTLPAVVTRAGNVAPIALVDVAETLRAFGAAAELTVDVEHSGYPIGHADYELRTIQLGGEHAAVVLDAHDQEQIGLAALLLREAKVLHAHSATADLIPLADAGVIDDLDHAWDRMHDTAILAKLSDPSSTGNDADLKGLAGAVLGAAACSPAADESRAALFKAGKWLTDIKTTTPVARSGWAQSDQRSTTMIRLRRLRRPRRRRPRPPPTRSAVRGTRAGTHRAAHDRPRYPPRSRPRRRACGQAAAAATHRARRRRRPVACLRYREPRQRPADRRRGRPAGALRCPTPRPAGPLSRRVCWSPTAAPTARSAGSSGPAWTTRKPRPRSGCSSSPITSWCTAATAGHDQPSTPSAPTPAA